MTHKNEEKQTVTKSRFICHICHR